MHIKFIYPQSTPNVAVVRSKKTGYIKRRWQAEMPVELSTHCSIEDYDKAIRSLNNVAAITLWGQLLSLLPSLITGAIAFGVGESKKTDSYTPIYWYIGILLLAITLLGLVLMLLTLKRKYLRNLAYSVSKIHTHFNNHYGINWTLRYVDFTNKRGKRRPKIWCELNIPVSPLAEQPLVAYPVPYPNQPPVHYIPMQHFHNQSTTTGLPQPNYATYSEIPIDDNQQHQYQQQPVSLSKESDNPKIEK
ncbi:hypothetical protein PPL_09805 [Heterostelium album PN500]|uniref:Uncharacterized protein n=1 Tax=Heterostelium pallidum (strain ATCC 26659 / Pp 5 / PN500) TaxID=670386 RepID=D3BP42_HETP5|nr:hypothetical protein PPL_09805 [Heterostelium album PN500]EFA77052.1 hypothetical protein PPL_09805 [Heterostelium album PN500]|eukprot:XP_020429182.1 hypothetical protein PPL_09805 [Heterostelium album PN500]